MHVVLAILSAIISLLYILDRLGIDLGGMNPFYWRRRRAWAARYESDPIYSVEDPKHVAAILVLGIAKLDGDLSAEQKKAALEQFRTVFSLETKDASDLLGSAAHLLGAPQVIDMQLKGVAEKNAGKFSTDQAESMLKMMTVVANADGKVSERQNDYLENIRNQYLVEHENGGTWST